MTRTAVGVVSLALLSTVAALSGCSTDRAAVTVERAPTNGGSTGTASYGVGADGSAVVPTPEDAAAAVSGAAPVEANANVVHLSDGDTITVQFADGGTEKVRLIGIDTPETHRPNTPVQCFGPEASRFLAALIPIGTAVRIERDVEERDRYGRLLAYVYRAADGVFVNRSIAANGYANLLTYPPNIAHADDFADAVQDAREHERGLWRACPTTVGS